MTKNLFRWETWAQGLLAAFIGGGSSAIVASVTVAMIDPQKFNLGSQLGHFFELAGTVFITSGVLSAASYLKQSPLPAPDVMTYDAVAQSTAPSGAKTQTVTHIETTTEKNTP